MNLIKKNSPNPDFMHKPEESHPSQHAVLEAPSLKATPNDANPPQNYQIPSVAVGQTLSRELDPRRL